jgi:hypothetical protein
VPAEGGADGALAGEPQDIVLGQIESADGRFIIDAGVRPMPVVAVNRLAGRSLVTKVA